MRKESTAYISQDQIYDRWKFGNFSRIKLKKIRPLLLKRKNLLDVGCGDGSFYEGIKDIPLKYTGIDISGVQVNVARKKGLTAVKHDLTTPWPFKSNAFDVIIASEIIEHVFDTDFFLQECKRVLTKNGTLVITTPNVCALGERIRCLSGRRPSVIDYRTNNSTSGHIRAFSIYDLKQLIRDNGLIMESYTGSDFFLPIISSDMRFFGKINEWLCSIFPKFSAGFIIKIRKR